tara:strand:- start:1366 stop:3012 length:1647 start_codon:yes stop_codon:yes gene_type:complete
MNKNIIDIEAGAGVFRYFKSLPLSFESSLGELVDNSIASWLKNKKILPDDFKLEINISLDHSKKSISIFDNACGIGEEDFNRAFKTGHIPDDATSLNEFGAGMKVSSFWFGDKWIVRTKPINEKYQKTVIFDLDEIEKKGTQIKFKSEVCKKTEHYTEITLFASSHFPSSKDLKNIRSHLSSMFRNWLGDDKIEIIIDGTRLFWKEPAILFMQSAKDPNDPNWSNKKKKYWSEIVDYQYKDGSNRAVKGYVGLLETPSAKDAGFSLIRRGRVIEGGIRSWKPGSESKHNIFEHAKSNQYSRLFGELEFINFQVDNHKTKILWNSPDMENATESKDAFLQYLSNLIKKDSRGNDKDFWYQLSEWKKIKKEVNKKIIETEKAKNITPMIKSASKHTEAVLESEHSHIQMPEISELNTKDKDIKENKTYQSIEFPINNKNESWNIIIKPVETELPKSSWFTTSFESDKHEWPQIITIKVNLSHQHSRNIFRLGTPGDIYTEISPEIYRLLAYMAIAERKLTFTSSTQGEFPGTYKRYINETINRVTGNLKQ